MNPVVPFQRRDWVTMVGLTLIAGVLRVPFRSAFAWFWDNAQFALAVGEYNIGIGQPHRPGYFLYVMLGRLVHIIVPDAHTALVWLSVVAGSLLVGLVYGLGTAMFGRRCGLAAALVAMSSPLAWFASEVALTNIVDAALVTGLMWVLWRIRTDGGQWPNVIGAAFLFAAVAGVRQQTAPCLLPAIGYVFWTIPSARIPKLIVATTLATVLCLAWFVPMVTMSGGLDVYLEVLRGRGAMDRAATPWGSGPERALENLRAILAAVWVGVAAGGLVALAALVVALRTATRERWALFWREHSPAVTLLGLWVAPLVALGIGTFVYRPDYILSYLPALLVLLGLVVTRVRAGVWWAGLAAVVNLAVFALPSPAIEGLLLSQPVTAARIRQENDELRQIFACLRAHYAPESVVLVHANQFFRCGLRQFQYHAPEYTNVLLKHDPALAPAYRDSFWVTEGQRMRFEPQIPSFGNRQPLLVVPAGESVNIFEPWFDVGRCEAVSGANGRLYEARK